MIVLDASVVIAALDREDALHHEASDLLRGLVPARFSMHALTLAECLVGATRDGSGHLLLRRIRALGVTVQDERDDPLELAELRAHTGLRMPDCCVLLAALRTRSRLCTFDDRLAAAALRLGVSPAG